MWWITVLKSGSNQAIFFKRDPLRQETLLYLVGDSPSKSGLTLNFILIFHKYRKAMLKKSYQLSG